MPPVSAHLATDRAGHRSRRWRIMRGLRSLAFDAGLRSVAFCSTRTLDGVASVTRSSEGCSWSGLQRCKSPHACPRCSLDLAHRNASTVERIETAAREKGLAIDLVTLTHPHERGDSLDDCIDWVLGCWSRLWRSSSFRAKMLAHGFIGAIRAFEATHTANGWHCHLHVALVRRADGAADSSRVLVERWLALDRTRRASAQDVQFNVGAVADYVGKGSMRLGAELAAGNATKTAANGGRSPLQIAEAACAGDKQAMRLWREWITATKGRRAWHIIARASLQQALSLDIIEAQEPDDSTLQPIAQFDAAQFQTIRAHRAETLVLCLFEQFPGCRLQELPPKTLSEFLDWFAARHAGDPPFL